MKWKLPESGDRRTRRVFAWFPIDFNRYRYWLTTIEITEYYSDCYDGEFGVWIKTEVKEV